MPPITVTMTSTSKIPTRQPRLHLPWATETPVSTMELRSTPKPSPQMLQTPAFSRVTIAGINRSSGPLRTSLVEEYIVLLNSGDPVDLMNWTLTVGEIRRYVFPGARIETNEIIRIHTGTGTNTRTDLYWGQMTSLFQESGTLIVLKNQTGAVIDRFQP